MIWVIFVAMLVLLVSVAFTLWDEQRWRRDADSAMRHRREVRRGRGHTRREEED